MRLSSEGFPVIEKADDPVVINEALHYSLKVWEDVRPDDWGHTSQVQDAEGLIQDAFGLPPIPDFKTIPTREGPATIFVTPEDLALCLQAYWQAINEGQVDLGEDTNPEVMLSLDDGLAALRFLGVPPEDEAS